MRTSAPSAYTFSPFLHATQGEKIENTGKREIQPAASLELGGTQLDSGMLVGSGTGPINSFVKGHDFALAEKSNFGLAL
jgi:hypothetical protein